jgi:hypothetical protein
MYPPALAANSCAGETGYLTIEKIVVFRADAERERGSRKGCDDERSPKGAEGEPKIRHAASSADYRAAPSRDQGLLVALFGSVPSTV